MKKIIYVPDVPLSFFKICLQEAKMRKDDHTVTFLTRFIKTEQQRERRRKKGL
ncbi:MAG TPA: hypothetical protein PLF70_00265 [Candidatus Portnoybacteria bacterium]|jgi:ferritin|nr:hypothetical protein [Candidatus Portnoybacteria bacterium]HPH51969.1 hypothetical protein [Candidatus Portnoybacteria bacterium]HPJ80130.1 hypothetical protein [Candidatus Portnoybacteria bacterium]HPM28203.1 hypothetical protein [Candidatus Portnoybacteria bacterium]